MQFRRLVQDKIFPSWRIKGATEWWWVKTASETGEPVWPLDATHRRCYEGAHSFISFLFDVLLTLAPYRPTHRPLRPARRQEGRAADHPAGQDLSLDADRSLTQAHHSRYVPAQLDPSLMLRQRRG